MIVIEAGKIIDGTGSKPKTGYSLVIENGLIRDIVKTNSLQKTGDMDVVDAKDKTIIPGLIDCHVHLTSPWTKLQQFLLPVATHKKSGLPDCPRN